MEMKVEIPFQQLLSVVKTLTPNQRAKLLAELQEEKEEIKDEDDFISLLLNGPVYSDKEIHVIEENSKSIAKWRTKN